MEYGELPRLKAMHYEAKAAMADLMIGAAVSVQRIVPPGAANYSEPYLQAWVAWDGTE